MKNLDINNLLQEEQLNESIIYLLRKISNIDTGIEEEKMELLNYENKLKELLLNKDEVKQRDKSTNKLPPFCQYILQKNEECNDRIEKIKNKIDQNKILCNKKKKEKKQIEIIVNYLKKWQKIKENSFAEISKQKYKEKQYLDLALLVFETQENEKKRIARDLHDTTVQTLVSMIHKLELSMRVMDNDPVRSKLELQVLIKTLHATINDMRSMIYDLRPLSVDDIGLVVTLERFARQTSINNQDVEITVNVLSDELDLSPIVNLNIFRVIQESCLNAIKSGKATKIEILLKYENDNFFITIVDNGIGFSYNDNINGSTKNFGLSIMKERISLLDGEIAIDSIIGEGTTIKIDIPIAKNREIINNHGEN